MNLKGILFDFDGVVVKSMEYHLQAWKYAFKKISVEIKDNEFYLLEGRGVKAVAAELIEKHNLDQNLVQQIIDIKIEYFDKINNVEFYDGFFKLLNFLKSKSILMAIVTGGLRTRVHHFVKKYLDGYFSAIICSDDVEKTKPFPEPYIKGIKALGLGHDECLVIENAPLGIQSAKTAKIKVIAIETTLPKNYLTEADHVVQSFSEVQTIIQNHLHITQITV
jgi:HAD superfamily hydrolase (TIGR01509 family)